MENTDLATALICIIINVHRIQWGTRCWSESHIEGEKAELNLAVLQAEKNKVIPGKKIKANWHERAWCTLGKTYNSVWLEHWIYVGRHKG